MMMMPVYPGAPWLPKFEGVEGEDKYREWKEQISGLLSTQDADEAKRVAILYKTLTGEARRQVSVLESAERDTVKKIFKYLDGLYKETIPLSQIRVQFYSCAQRPDESISSYILRLRELVCRLRRDDPTAAPSDSVLRDQLIMGLSDGPLSQALRIYARRYPDKDFTALREEAVLLAAEQGSRRATEIECQAVNPTPLPKPSQTADWKRELRQEIMEDVKTQLHGLTKELLTEIRPLLQTAAAARPRSPPPAEQRYARPNHRYVPQNRDEWDETGRPICRQCKMPGHMARVCRAERQPLNY